LGLKPIASRRRCFSAVSANMMPKGSGSGAASGSGLLQKNMIRPPKPPPPSTAHRKRPEAEAALPLTGTHDGKRGVESRRVFGGMLNDILKKACGGGLEAPKGN
jgi:hypothetical protein